MLKASHAEHLGLATKEERKLQKKFSVGFSLRTNSEVKAKVVELRMLLVGGVFGKLFRFRSKLFEERLCGN